MNCYLAYCVGASFVASLLINTRNSFDQDLPHRISSRGLARLDLCWTGDEDVGLGIERVNSQHNGVNLGMDSRIISCRLLL